MERTTRSLDWHLLEQAEHAGIQSLVRDLNRAYRAEPALWELDYDHEGFWWLEANDADDSVIAFARRIGDAERVVVCVGEPLAGAAPRLPARAPARRPLARGAEHRLGYYGGCDVATSAASRPRRSRWHGQPFSAELTLPPLGVLWLVPDDD